MKLHILYLAFPSNVLLIIVRLRRNIMIIASYEKGNVFESVHQPRPITSNNEQYLIVAIKILY